MALSENRVKVTNSERVPVRGARRIADAPPDESVTVSVIVRRPQLAKSAEWSPGGDPEAQRQERRASFAAVASAEDEVNRVVTFAAAHKLTVVEQDASRCTVVLSGTVAAMNEAFGVALGTYEGHDVRYRGREGSVTIPAELSDIVVAVLGLDNRPQARAHFRRGPTLTEAELDAPEADPFELLARNGSAAAPLPKPFWPAHVSRLYGRPNAVTGAGETIAIIELGGGYKPAELQQYFARAGVPAPTVTNVAVDHGDNTPGGDADGEVLLDIEVAGSVAPGAKIVVYFADNTDRGFLDAITTAVHDQKNAPSVVSISWGAPEVQWTPQAMDAFDQAFGEAAALGVAIFCAAGDHGASDGGRDGKVHADFPASSPHVVACGGTTLLGHSNNIVSEVVWNDQDGWAGGGGISDHFPLPAFQTAEGVPASLDGAGTGRGVPDIAGNADITTGYTTLVDGQWGAIGGTSAVAPLYSAMLALINQSLGRPGAALPISLYQVPATGRGTVFHDITVGDNTTPTSPDTGSATTGYPAVRGWDACTGLGSINAAALLQHL